MRAIILLAILGTVLAVPKHGSRIIGGSPTTIQQYPFMSSMQFRWFQSMWSHFCGGSLITTTSVLSSAHCFFNSDSTSAWRVALGSTTTIYDDSIAHDIQQFIFHPQYNQFTLNNNVAIVRLASAAQLSNIIGLARIAGPNYNLAAGTTVTAIGWGFPWSPGPSTMNLHHVNINIIDHNLCAERYAYLKTQPGLQNYPDVTDGMVCAGILNVGGADACQGDYGGPLLHTGDIVYGITSWGYSCAHPDYPGVSTRVSAYSNWIVDNA